MNKEMPKNIRQIGNVSDSTKVYIEDYVDTYIKQLKSRDDDEPIGIFLLGTHKEEDAQEYFLVSGALLMKNIRKEKDAIIVGKDTWKIACEESKKYFNSLAILGWAIVSDNGKLGISPQVNRTHERLFKKSKSIYIRIDKNDTHENIYAQKFNSLMEMQGHYIYYEKNPMMQEYMISNRKENHLPPSETYEDRAAQNFRTVIQSKPARFSKVKRNSLGLWAGLVGVSALAIVVQGRYEVLQEIGSAIFGNQKAGDETIETGAEINDNDSQSSEMESLNIIVDKVESPLESEDLTIIPGIAQEVIDAVLSSDANDQQNTAQESTGVNVETNTPTTTETTNATEYIVQDGDTLGKICKKYYGTTQNLQQVYAYNGIDETDYIYIGQTIYLP